MDNSSNATHYNGDFLVHDVLTVKTQFHDHIDCPKIPWFDGEEDRVTGKEIKHRIFIHHIDS
jgi:hypothetical protein